MRGGADAECMPVRARALPRRRAPRLRGGSWLPLCLCLLRVMGLLTLDLTLLKPSSVCEPGGSAQDLAAACLLARQRL